MEVANFIMFMDFFTFLDILTNLKEIELGGSMAHLQMAPSVRLKEMPSLDFSKIQPKKAAVLLHLYPSDKGKVCLVLIQRNVYNGPHSGQISLPGGKSDVDDPTLWDTALREAQEEVGLEPKQVKYLRKLTDIYVPPSNYLIRPFVGYSGNQCDFIPNADEVTEIIEIQLNYLIKIGKTTTVQSSSSYGPMKVPTYVLGPYEVWGATAMILSEFKMLLADGLSK